MDKKLRVLFLSQSCLIKYGLKSGFDQLGHQTSFLDNECYAIWEKHYEIQLKLIMQRIQDFKPDLVFSEGYANIPLVELYFQLKKMGIPLMLWDIEADCTPSIGEFFSRNCDYLWTTMGEKVQSFESRGIKSGTLLFGCNPEFHKPAPSEDRFRHDISLVARNYSNRYKESKWFILDLLEKQKYDVKIYGIWWMDKTRPVNLLKYSDNYWSEYGDNADLPYEWLPIVVNSSKVMLGMNVPVNSEVHCSMRPFETLASSDNSLLVGHFQQGQKNIFGDYMYHVNSTEEAELAINEILSMTDNQRKEKARLGREFVYREHNYKLRAQQIIDKFYVLGGN